GCFLALRLDHLLQRMLIENADEGAEGVVEQLIECGKLARGTRAGLVLPLDLEMQDLHRAYHVADADLGGRLGEADPAMATAHSANEARTREQVHDLERVLERDVAPLGNFGDLDEVWFGESAVKQN